MRIIKHIVCAIFFILTGVPIRLVSLAVIPWGLIFALHEWSCGKGTRDRENLCDLIKWIFSTKKFEELF